MLGLLSTNIQQLPFFQGGHLTLLLSWPGTANPKQFEDDFGH